MRVCLIMWLFACVVGSECVWLVGSVCLFVKMCVSLSGCICCVFVEVFVYLLCVCLWNLCSENAPSFVMKMHHISDRGRAAHNMCARAVVWLFVSLVACLSA